MGTLVFFLPSTPKVGVSNDHGSSDDGGVNYFISSIVLPLLLLANLKFM